MKDPQLEAMRLVNKFTLYGFIKDPETSDLMVSFAKFAAIQHVYQKSQRLRRQSQQLL
jgi:hypothetical protein